MTHKLQEERWCVELTVFVGPHVLSMRWGDFPELRRAREAAFRAKAITFERPLDPAGNLSIAYPEHTEMVRVSSCAFKEILTEPVSSITNVAVGEGPLELEEVGRILETDPSSRYAIAAFRVWPHPDAATNLSA